MRAGIFRLVDPPTPDDEAIARAVIAAYDFPWEWTVHRNVRETGRAFLPIGWKDRQGSLGWYDPVLNGSHTDAIAELGSAVKAGYTLAHELGHLIDDTVLFNETRREIHGLMHADSSVPLGECPSGVYWRNATHRNSPSEAFANLAPHIWCPIHAKPIDRYGPHHFTRLDEIKELVMADAVKNPPFDDIAGTEHEDDILWAAGRGIAFGRDGSFLPNAPVSRGQMCAFLRRALDEEPSRG